MKKDWVKKRKVTKQYREDHINKVLNYEIDEELRSKLANMI